MTAPLPRLLLIDDDRKLTRLLSDYLQPQGFEVAAEHDGLAGLERAKTGAWDLVVLDLMLPQVDGLSVLKHLRTISDVPVLMLTGRGGDEDRVAGLDLGADDYLPKTASARELLSRIRAVLRRTVRSAAPVPAPEALDLGRLVIDPAARTVRLDGQAVELTAAEFDLLAALARHAGQVRTRAQLHAAVSDRPFDDADRTIDVHVAALRRKLADDPRSPTLLRTVRSVGYVLSTKPGS